MKTRTTTFARMKKFVESLGLTHGRGPEQQEYFQEPNDGEVLLILPKYRPNQLVRPAHLLGLRYLLIGRGWVKPEDFDRFLEEEKKRA